MNEKEEWVTMSEAARIVRVSVAKLSNMANRGEIKTKDNPRDRRVVLVDLNELRRHFGE